MRIFTATLFIWACILMNDIQSEENIPSSVDPINNIFEKDKNGNVIPDFSSAGYMGGGVALPHARTLIELFPTSKGDDRQRIQVALDKIAELPRDANGFRGALLLKKGQYRVKGSIYIKKSGIILRGEGQFLDGTSIIATKKDYSKFNKKHSLIYIGTPKRSFPKLGFLEKKGSEIEITDQYVPVGSNKINLQNSQDLHVGDNIIIELLPNHKWLETIKLESVWGDELPYLYQRYERRIVAIHDTQITIDAPLVNIIDENLFKKACVWKYEDNARIEKCAVESIRCISLYDENNLDDENHAISAIFINHAKDCWVKNMTALHFSDSAVDISYGARNVTVEDCAFLRPVSFVVGSRRYAFMINGSRCLVQRCYSREARHAFVSSSRARGPNVFLDCMSERDFAEIGPHHRWATGFLYDNIVSPQGRIYVQNRLKMAKHGWTGANIVFWNCKCAEIMCDTPGSRDDNWCVGCIASKVSGWMHYPGKRFGTWISHGRHVKPRSLYLYQLKQRLGAAAVVNITINLQRDDNCNDIDKYLKEKFAELNQREKSNDGNMFLNYSFNNMEIKTSNALKKKIYTLPGYWKLENGGDFKRIPYSKNVFALEIPAGAVLSSMVRAINYPSAVKSEFSLKFDYRIKKQNTIKITVLCYIIKYNKNWIRVNTYNISPALGHIGDSQWEKYSYKFDVNPVLDPKTNMPYPTYLKILFSSSDGTFEIVNPSLKIVEK